MSISKPGNLYQLWTNFTYTIYCGKASFGPMNLTVQSSVTKITYVHPLTSGTNQILSHNLNDFDYEFSIKIVDSNGFGIQGKQLSDRIKVFLSIR